MSRVYRAVHLVPGLHPEILIGRASYVEARAVALVEVETRWRKLSQRAQAGIPESYWWQLVRQTGVAETPIGTFRIERTDFDKSEFSHFGVRVRAGGGRDGMRVGPWPVRKFDEQLRSVGHNFRDCFRVLRNSIMASAPSVEAQEDAIRSLNLTGRATYLDVDGRVRTCWIADPAAGPDYGVPIIGRYLGREYPEPEPPEVF